VTSKSAVFYVPSASYASEFLGVGVGGERPAVRPATGCGNHNLNEGYIGCADCDRQPAPALMLRDGHGNRCPLSRARACTVLARREDPHRIGDASAVFYNHHVDANLWMLVGLDGLHVEYAFVVVRTGPPPNAECPSGEHTFDYAGDDAIEIEVGAYGVNFGPKTSASDDLIALVTVLVARCGGRVEVIP